MQLIFRVLGHLLKLFHNFCVLLLLFLFLLRQINYLMLFDFHFQWYEIKKKIDERNHDTFVIFRSKYCINYWITKNSESETEKNALKRVEVIGYASLAVRCDVRRVKSFSGWKACRMSAQLTRSFLALTTAASYCR